MASVLAPEAVPTPTTVAAVMSAPRPPLPPLFCVLVLLEAASCLARTVVGWRRTSTTVIFAALSAPSRGGVVPFVSRHRVGTRRQQCLDHHRILVVLGRIMQRCLFALILGVRVGTRRQKCLDHQRVFVVLGREMQRRLFVLISGVRVGARRQQCLNYRRFPVFGRKMQWRPFGHTLYVQVGTLLKASFHVLDLCRLEKPIRPPLPQVALWCRLWLSWPGVSDHSPFLLLPLRGPTSTRLNCDRDLARPPAALVRSRLLVAPCAPQWHLALCSSTPELPHVQRFGWLTTRCTYRHRAPCSRGQVNRPLSYFGGMPTRS